MKIIKPDIQQKGEGESNTHCAYNILIMSNEITTYSSEHESKKMREEGLKLYMTKKLNRRQALSKGSVGNHEDPKFELLGVGNPLSVRALKHLINIHHHDIVFLSEVKFLYLFLKDLFLTFLLV